MKFSSLESRRCGSMCSRHVYQCVFTVYRRRVDRNDAQKKKNMVRNAIRQLTITFNLNWSAHIFQMNREWERRLHEVFSFVHCFSSNSKESHRWHFANKFVRIVLQQARSSSSVKWKLYIWDASAKPHAHNQMSAGTLMAPPIHHLYFSWSWHS